MHFRLVTRKNRNYGGRYWTKGRHPDPFGGNIRGMKFLAAEFLRFSVPRAAPYGEALTPAANAIFFLLASGYKRTKIRCRDESYSLCPVIPLRATFRSREISCRVSEPRATPITALPLTFPTFPVAKYFAFVEMHWLPFCYPR